MRLPNETEEPFEINILPAIDVIFSVLAFFVISTLYLTRSLGLPVNLPEATTTEIQGSSQVYITVAADGAIALNGEPITLEQLTERASQLVKPDSQQLMIINADDRVAHGLVVEIMDKLRQIEGVKLAIAAKEPSN